jgi:hypothetical protein
MFIDYAYYFTHTATLRRAEVNMYGDNEYYEDESLSCFAYFSPFETEIFERLGSQQLFRGGENMWFALCPITANLRVGDLLENITDMYGNVILEKGTVAHIVKYHHWNEGPQVIRVVLGTN